MTSLLLATLALLVLAALVVARYPLPSVARTAALLTLAFALGLAVHALTASTPAVAGAPLFDDALTALFAPLASLIACAVLLAAPARELEARTLASVLLSLAATLAALCASELGVFTCAWIVGLLAIGIGLPRGPSHRRLRRGFAVYAALGTAPLVLALAILARVHDTSFVPSAQRPSAVPFATQHLVFFLLALAAAFRSGLVPLHAWLPALTGRTPVAVSVLLFGAPLGPVLVARALVPLTPLVAASDLTAFSSWAVASALYAAVLALVQRDLKRTLGFVLTSQSALLLFGVSGSDPESVHGALLGALGLGLSAGGLLLLAAALEARTGSGELVHLEGQGRGLPRMTALFFLLAAAAIGLPGTLPFVAEDLLLHGLLRASPTGAFFFLLVAVLNGITLLRLFFRVFQGPTRKRAGTRDLGAREGLVIAGLLALTVLGGISPSLLLSLQAPSVRTLSAIEHVPVARH